MPWSKEVSGTFGGDKTPCTVLTYPQRDGSTWYAVEGSRNINLTFEPVEEGVNVEILTDCDTMQADRDVDTLDDLEREVDE